MFICSVGNHVSKRGEKCTKVVTKKRDREYARAEYIDKEGLVTWDSGGIGWEIVKEEKRCEEHANT